MNQEKHAVNSPLQNSEVSPLQGTSRISTRVTHHRRSFANWVAVCLCSISVLSGCAAFLGPSYSDHVWYKKGGSVTQRDSYLAEADLLATRSIQDPVGVDTSEPINAPAIRQQRRNEIIIKYMRTKGWQLMPKDQVPH